jgi:hypothetical protein
VSRCHTIFNLRNVIWLYVGSENIEM